jgi:hypothetical protein
MPDCHWLLKFGYCSAGDECLYYHPHTKKRVCEDYARGFCYYGASPRFSWPPSAMSSSAIVQLASLTLTSRARIIRPPACRPGLPSTAHPLDPLPALCRRFLPFGSQLPPGPSEAAAAPARGLPPSLAAERDAPGPPAAGLRPLGRVGPQSGPGPFRQRSWRRRDWWARRRRWTGRSRHERRPLLQVRSEGPLCQPVRPAPCFHPVACSVPRKSAHVSSPAHSCPNRNVPGNRGGLDRTGMPIAK